MIPMTTSLPEEDNKVRSNVVLLWGNMRIKAEVYEHTEEDKTLVDEFKVESIECANTGEPIEATDVFKVDILLAYLEGEAYVESGVFQ